MKLILYHPQVAALADSTAPGNMPPSPRLHIETVSSHPEPSYSEYLLRAVKIEPKGVFDVRIAII